MQIIKRCLQPGIGVNVNSWCRIVSRSRSAQAPPLSADDGNQICLTFRSSRARLCPSNCLPVMYRSGCSAALNPAAGRRACGLPARPSKKLDGGLFD